VKTVARRAAESRFGPRWKHFFWPHGKDGPAWGQTGKEYRERRSQDGRWPHVSSTLQITAALHMSYYQGRQKRMQHKRALGPLSELRAPLILTGFPHGHWFCYLRSWPQNSDPRWQDKLKFSGIFSRNLFSFAVRNETKCRSQTVQPITWRVFTVWSVIQMAMTSGLPDRLKMWIFTFP